MGQWPLKWAPNWPSCEEGCEHDFRLNFRWDLRKLKRKSKRAQGFSKIFAQIKAQIEASVSFLTSICAKICANPSMRKYFCFDFHKSKHKSKRAHTFSHILIGLDQRDEFPEKLHSRVHLLIIQFSPFGQIAFFTASRKIFQFEESLMNIRSWNLEPMISELPFVFGFALWITLSEFRLLDTHTDSVDYQDRWSWSTS